MIPKILHYVWVGSDIPDRVTELINHNKKYTSDYEIKIWTKQNLPALNDFAKKALSKKNWAFVSDYVRFVALHRMGGVYLDTDQKLLRNIDDLLDFKFFSGWNPDKSYIYTGIIGCEPELDFVSKILLTYNDLEYSKRYSSPKVLTGCYRDFASKENFKIFDSTYFYPVGVGEKSEGKILEHTYATHLWDESWVSFVPLRRLLRWLGIMRIYHYVVKRLI